MSKNTNATFNNKPAIEIVQYLLKVFAKIFCPLSGGDNTTKPPAPSNDELKLFFFENN